MKSALILLVLCLNTLTSGCAFAMGRGQQQCSSIEIPARPQYEICIANASGGGGCHDDRANPSEYIRPSINNYVCFKASEYQSNEEWMKFIIDSCKR